MRWHEMTWNDMKWHDIPNFGTTGAPVFAEVFEVFEDRGAISVPDVFIADGGEPPQLEVAAQRAAGSHRQGSPGMFTRNGDKQLSFFDVLVGGLEHGFYFSHIYIYIYWEWSSQLLLTPSFFRGVETTTNQCFFGRFPLPSGNLT